MGEYFNDTKLGTCNHLMYVNRIELENRVQLYPYEKNSNPGNFTTLSEYLKLEHNYIYRFPFKDEVNQSWDDIKCRDARILRVSIDPEYIEIPHKEFMQVELNNKVFNLPFCPYGEKASDLGIKRINNYYIDINIIGEVYNTKNPEGYTLLECPMCNSYFSLNDKERDYLQKRLSSMGMDYEAGLIKTRSA